MSQTAAAGEAPRIKDRAADLPVRSRGALKRILRPILTLGGILVVAVTASVYWLYGGRYVSIDNAYIRAAKEVISTDISGTVTDVLVREGQLVKKDELLVRISATRFEIAVAGATAALNGTVATLNARKLEYKRMLREVEAKQAQVEADRANYDRLASLVRSGGVTRAEFDNIRFQLAANQQAAAALQVAAEVQLARLGGDPDADVRTLPDYLQAKATLDEALRQLRHTELRAPFNGVVTQVESVQPGMYLAAATAAFGIVSRDRMWIDANPKETELTHVRVGNPVSITVDTYPGKRWTGAVESIAPNSGSEFAILPAQNTSGNWVKVVQRIPVRIRIDRKPGDPDLRSGMSVVAEIDTGHKRTLRDLWP
jgi:membrane fusion protein (multidrug efflux system)